MTLNFKSVQEYELIKLKVFRFYLFFKIFHDHLSHFSFFSFDLHYCNFVNFYFHNLVHPQLLIRTLQKDQIRTPKRI